MDFVRLFVMNSLLPGVYLEKRIDKCENLNSFAPLRTVTSLEQCGYECARGDAKFLFWRGDPKYCNCIIVCGGSRSSPFEQYALVTGKIIIFILQRYKKQCKYNMNHK